MDKTIDIKQTKNLIEKLCNEAASDISSAKLALDQNEYRITEVKINHAKEQLATAEDLAEYLVQEDSD